MNKMHDQKHFKQHEGINLPWLIYSKQRENLRNKFSIGTFWNLLSQFAFLELELICIVWIVLKVLCVISDLKILLWGKRNQ